MTQRANAIMYVSAQHNAFSEIHMKEARRFSSLFPSELEPKGSSCGSFLQTPLLQTPFSSNLSIFLRSRLCPEDLNSSVLSYMTDTLGYSRSDIIYTLTNNRPSAIMACYHLLLNKLGRSLKGTKAIKVLASSAPTETLLESNISHERYL